MRIVAIALVVSACSLAGSPVSTDGPVATPAVTTTSGVTVTTAEDAPSTTVSSVTTVTLPEFTGLVYQTIAEDVPFPVMLIPAGSGDLLATKDGHVFGFGAQGVGDVIVDISDRVRNSGEQGLLGMAESEGRIFLHYTANNGDTVVSEITDGEKEILRLSQPAGNHNGGMLQFGPGGYLYLGLGDGGGAGDRYGNGQNTSTLLGGIVRIDIVTGESVLWSYGLRNPWRFSFDGDTLYIGDVGQGSYEEIDVVAYAEGGYNFGWPVTEGRHCFSPRRQCDTGGLTLPEVEIEHGDGGACSITGGVVYRGKEIPEIVGQYLFSDYCGGWLRSFRWDGSTPQIEDWTGQVGIPGRVVSFGTDSGGEVYVLTESAVLKLVAVRSG